MWLGWPRNQVGERERATGRTKRRGNEAGVRRGGGKREHNLKCTLGPLYLICILLSTSSLPPSTSPSPSCFFTFTKPAHHITSHHEAPPMQYTPCIACTHAMHCIHTRHAFHGMRARCQIKWSRTAFSIDTRRALHCIPTLRIKL